MDTLTREDYIDRHRNVAKEEIQDNAPVDDAQTLSALKFALPIIRWTDRQMRLMLSMSEAPLTLALFLLGNRLVKQGYIHQYRVSEIAKYVGFERQTIYSAMNVLNALGFSRLRIKNKKLCGKILDSPTQRVKDEAAKDLYPLKIATLHTDYLIPFLSASPSSLTLKQYLLVAFHCNESTGEINTEMRPVEWAEMLGCHRRTAEKNFDWIIEREFMCAKRDYVVIGRHPGVAMGHWQYVLTTLEKEKQTLESKKISKKGVKPFEDVLLTLRKLFGIDARGWAYGHIEEARRLLSEKINLEGYAEFQKMRKQLEQAQSA